MNLPEPDDDGTWNSVLLQTYTDEWGGVVAHDYQYTTLHMTVGEAEEVAYALLAAAEKARGNKK